MVRQFTPADLPLINSWLIKRNLPALHQEHLPATGFVADEIAAGFLYKTDSTMAFIESLVTCPVAPGSTESLNKVIEAISVNAQSEGFKQLIGITSNPHIVQKAIAHGFLEHPVTYRLVNKSL